jgi:hypothetical protein
MIRRLRDYLLSLTVVLTTFWLYAQTAARLIEPAPSAPRMQGPAITPNEPQRRNPFEHLFAPGDWELANPKVLETAQGTLLFQEYLLKEQGRMEIRPCTLIVFSTEKKAGDSSISARPIVLQAHQGAVLQLEGAVDFTRGQFGRLVGGRIQGDIRIFSPESLPGAADSLEIHTRNVQIEQLKVWTPHEVKFRYGSNSGSGHDFILNLAPSEKTGTGKMRAPSFSGVESLQLTQVDEIKLQAATGNLFPNASAQATTAGAAPAAEPVRITCEGPFKFDMVRRVATFEDNVQAQRMTNMGVPDRLTCKQLAVFFTPEKEPAAEVTAAQEQSSAEAKSTAKTATQGIERLVAVGTPVVMEAPSQQAYCEAERLEYNLPLRQVLLKMLNSGARVKLKRGNEEFVAPELAYEIGADQRVGRLWAPGPGRLQSVQGTGADRRVVTADWRREIRLRPHEGNVVISLMDDARIEVEQQGTFRGNELHLWLLETPPPTGATTATSTLIPDRLLAAGFVRINSPQLSANVDRLEAWFEHTPAELPPPKVTPSETKPELQLNTAAGNAPATPPGRALPIVEPRGLPASNQPGQQPPHYHLVGETVRMQLKTNGSSASLENLSVEGKLIKINETNPPPNEQALQLQGTKIDLEGGIGETAIVTVQGQPATVVARDMSLRSSAFILNRRDNRLTVEQAGDLTLPMKQDFSGEPYERPQPLNIAWQGSFLFDGLVTRIRRGVSIRGPGFTAQSDELQAKLSRSLQFDAAQTAGAPEIKGLALTGSVKLENRMYGLDGHQQSLERLETQTLQLDRSTGQLVAEGPGWLSTVRLGSTKFISGAVTANQSSASPRGNDELGLSYLRVDFRQQMLGNLTKKQVEFNDQVEAVFGPVEHWEGEVKSNSIDALGDRGAILSSDKLTVADFSTPGSKASSIELAAVGNTRVEGRDFHAFASRLKYATGKNQLVLEGDGRQDAKIRRRADNTYLEAQRILYLRDTNVVQIDGSRVLTFGPAAATAPNQPRPTSPRDLPRR